EYPPGATVWAGAPIAASVMHRTAAIILRRSISLSSLNLSGGSVRPGRAERDRLTGLDYRRPSEGTNSDCRRRSYLLTFDAVNPGSHPGFLDYATAAHAFILTFPLC